MCEIKILKYMTRYYVYYVFGYFYLMNISSLQLKYVNFMILKCIIIINKIPIF